jgi:hypothetical protein
MTPVARPVSAATAWQALQLYARAYHAVARYLAAGKTDAAASLEAPAVSLAGLVATSPAMALALAAVRPDEDDPAHHSVRAGLLAAALGREVGLGEEAIADVLRVALAHEAGNRLLPDGLVDRAGALDADERRSLVRATPLAVARILREGPFDRVARLRIAVLDGLHEAGALVRRDEHGEVEAFGEAPRPAAIARLLAIGCAYDSLTSPRPYRDAFTAREAVAVAWTELAGRFDPSLLAVFQRLVGVGPVRVRADRPREAPVLAPGAGGLRTAEVGGAARASISIAGSGTVEIALDGEDAVELADPAGEPLVVEVAPQVDADALAAAEPAAPGDPDDEECVIVVDA